MDIKVFEYFIAVAEAQSFSKAAKLLYISQPTLSRQISFMEEELGTRLFTRNKSGVALTTAGELCLEKSKHILKEYQDMRQNLLEINKGSVGSASIGYVNLSQFKILSQSIDRIHNKYPGIKLEIHKMSLPHVQQALLDQKVDLIFDMRLDVNQNDKICYKNITDSKLYVVVSNRHPYASRESIQLNELEDEEMVIFERKQAPELFDSLVRLCSQSGFIPKFTKFYEDMESVIMAVGLGKGVTLMDETAKILETSHTIFVPIERCEVGYNWYLSWLKDNKNPSLQILIDNIYML